MLQLQVNQIDVLAIQYLSGIGNKIIIKLITNFAEVANKYHSFKEFLRYYLQQQFPTREVSQKEIEQAHNQADQAREKHYHQGIEIISYLDAKFPEQLREIKNPPLLIYLKGNYHCLNPQQSVAVIGTRNPSEFGRKSAFKIAKNLAESELIVVSGLAMGCDTAAHQGCLAGEGKTIAILAHGLDTIYPSQNQHLAEHILASQGCLLSEYPCGQKAYRYNFVERDRLQSALSSAVIVIETDVKGGTMHTVGFAREQKRILACIAHPEKEQTTQSRGNQQLIKEGLARPLFNKDNLAILIKEIKNKLEDIPSSTQQLSLPILETNSINQLINDQEVAKNVSVTPEIISDNKDSKPSPELLAVTPCLTQELLNGEKLAKRLSVVPSTISKHKKQGNIHFQEWSKNKDPEQIPWRYDETAKKYRPCISG